LLLSLVSGRGTVALWGYPLWLFLGLWIVMVAPPLASTTLARIVAIWSMVFVVFAAAFVIHYGVLAHFNYRYVAVLFPGDRLGQEISRRYRAMTGQPLVYVIGRMWDGGNVSHYAPERPRVLVDGSPRRAPWIDLGDLRARGAAVVWTSSDPKVLPPAFRAIADDAEIQAPFELPYRLGPGAVSVGWAVLRPRPALARQK
jgi:hypothetical protein